MIWHEMDDVAFALKEKHDFRWLKKFGNVFTVFNDQASGNLCFGVKSTGVKRFIKYAGAQPLRYFGKTDDAVEQLKKAKLNYEFLKHPSLVRLVHHEELKNGYVLQFDWADGKNMRHLNIDHLTFQERLNILDTIYAFHAFVEKKKFVSVGFRDESLIYDKDAGKVKICDIGHYERAPFTNDLERPPGSRRFMAPEEFQIGEILDERTNVYRMGAAAFSFLGKDPSLAESPIHKVAKRATSKQKEYRFQTVKEFYEVWKKALDVTIDVWGF
ncbi:serine/threonine protein kinase [Salicibibacter cibarius]|uniref:Serine/threonine protein kinase n=1 Tax=Salicibibacter cibarius TaxID=2743000 RepID=A0A7T7CAA3_9BACI|nr:serine/threonine-protein kinase [Salicibibacter cibarius]QQK74643.1 serine/threonine protein kinase [Salicibibacter cibarius]